MQVTEYLQLLPKKSMRQKKLLGPEHVGSFGVWLCVFLAEPLPQNTLPRPPNHHVPNGHFVLHFRCCWRNFHSHWWGTIQNMKHTLGHDLLFSFYIIYTFDAQFYPEDYTRQNEAQACMQALEVQSVLLMNPKVAFWQNWDLEFAIWNLNHWGCFSPNQSPP